MKSKLLMLLLAGFSMVMLPACGNDDDDEDVKDEVKKEDQKDDQKDNQKEEENNEGQENGTEEGYDFSSLAGTYYGQLVMVADGSVVADTVGVVVGATTKGTIDLALEPIVISGIPIDNLSFPKLPCAYDEATGVSSFSAKGLAVALVGGAVNATVDVNDGQFKNNGDLDFVVVVTASPMPPMEMKFSGKK